MILLLHCIADLQLVVWGGSTPFFIPRLIQENQSCPWRKLRGEQRTDFIERVDLDLLWSRGDSPWAPSPSEWDAPTRRHSTKRGRISATFNCIDPKDRFSPDLKQSFKKGFSPRRMREGGTCLERIWEKTLVPTLYHTHCARPLTQETSPHLLRAVGVALLMGPTMKRPLVRGVQWTQVGSSGVLKTGSPTQDTGTAESWLVCLLPQLSCTGGRGVDRGYPQSPVPTCSQRSSHAVVRACGLWVRIAVVVSLAEPSIAVWWVRRPGRQETPHKHRVSGAGVQHCLYVLRGALQPKRWLSKGEGEKWQRHNNRF